ncbi:MAG: FIST C-terminal domain-containing protein [Thermoanaerobaculales bacterium]|nr:FIST C-terminal domain-containing protein [Thermoanaerobaculales bacterium]
MKVAVAASTHSNAEQAATEGYEALLEELGDTPQLLLVHSSCDYDNEALVNRLRALAPDVPLQGGTSCLGVATQAGFHSQDGLGLGILGVLDPEGRYGVGIAEAGDDPEAATHAALEQALAEAGRTGEAPAAVITTVYPGDEEVMIRAVEQHLGRDVPIIGGSSADNDMRGQWRQFANDSVYRQAVSIATLFPSGGLGFAFHSGYEPTAHRGRVTRATRRTLYEIDGRPAAQVYNEWTGGLIADFLSDGGGLVPITAFSPLGVRFGRVAGVSYFRLSYPVEALEDGGLQLFAEIPEGREIVLMKGTADSLATRAGRVATQALKAAPFSANAVEGALVLYCAGCMLSIQDRIPEIVSGLDTAFDQAPFLCAFTLGEQGCFIEGENRHGNLMIAALVFGPADKE